MARYVKTILLLYFFSIDARLKSTEHIRNEICLIFLHTILVEISLQSVLISCKQYMGSFKSRMICNVTPKKSQNMNIINIKEQKQLKRTLKLFVVSSIPQ